MATHQTEQALYDGKVVKFCQEIIVCGVALLGFVIPLLISPLTTESAFLVKAATSELLIALILVAWIIKLAWASLPRGVQTSLTLPIIAYISWSGLTLLRATNFHKALYDFSLLVSFSLLYFAIISHVQRKNEVRFIVFFIVLAGLCVSIYGILQQWGFDPFTWYGAQAPKAYSSLSSLGRSNFAGEFLVVVIPLAIAFFFIAKGIKGKAFFCITGILLLIHLFFTQSRASWVAAFMGYPLVFLCSYVPRMHRYNEKHRFLKYPLLFSLLLLTGIFLLILLHPLAPSSGLQDTSSFMNRIDLWMSTSRMIAHHPLWGVGIGNYETGLPPYWSDKSRLLFVQENKTSNHAHNEYLEIMAETGIVGIGLFFWLASTLIGANFRLIHAFREKDREYSYLLFGFLCAFIAIFINALFTFNFHNPASGLLLWLLMGLLGAIESQYQRDYCQPSDMKGSLRPRRGLLRDITIVILGALVIFLTLHSLGNIFSNIHERKGLDLMRQERWKEACKEMEMSLRYAPYNDRVLFSTGVCHGMLGHLDEAIAMLERCLQSNPNHLNASHNIGFFYISRGQLEEGKRALTKFLSIVPEHYKGRVSLARYYFERGQWDEALREVRKALEYEPLNIGGLLLLADLFSIQDNPGEAEKIYNKIININPSLPIGHIGLSNVYLQNSQYAMAVKEIHHVLENQPDFLSAYQCLEKNTQYFKNPLLTKISFAQLSVFNSNHKK